MTDKARMWDTDLWTKERAIRKIREEMSMKASVPEKSTRTLRELLNQEVNELILWSSLMDSGICVLRQNLSQELMGGCM